MRIVKLCLPATEDAEDRLEVLIRVIMFYGICQWGFANGTPAAKIIKDGVNGSIVS